MGNLTIAQGAAPSAAELQTAQRLATQGYDVIVKPPLGRRSPAGGTADLLVNGVPYDIYHPRTSSAARIVSAVASKGSQARGVVLDLSAMSVTSEQLGDVLTRVQRAGSRLRHIIIVGR